MKLKMSSCRPVGRFALTLPLSPRRGNNGRPSPTLSRPARSTPSLECSRTAETILPLPGGEGRGEGLASFFGRKQPKLALDRVKSLTESTGSTVESTGSMAESAGSMAESAGSRAESAGSRAESTGSRAESTGSRAESAGSTVESAGSTVESAGSMVESAGSMVESAGSTVDSTGLRSVNRFEGRLDKENGQKPPFCGRAPRNGTII